jgi:hypothetical protein
MGERGIGVLTPAGNHGARREKEQVDVGLPVLDLPADVVDVLEQRQVRPDEAVRPARVERRQLGRDARGGPLGAADKVDARLDGVLGELLHSALADAAGAADEDGYEARRETLRNAVVGGPHLLEGDHLGGVSAWRRLVGNNESKERVDRWSKIHEGGSGVIQ